MKILFIAPSNALPPLSGGIIRTKALLEALAKKYEVTFATFYEDNKQKEQLKKKYKRTVLFRCGKTRFEEFVISLKSLFLGYSRPVSFIYNKEIIKKINNIIADFDFIFFDTCFHPVDKFKLTVPFAVSNHNVEFQVFAEISKASKFKIVSLREFYERGSRFQFPFLYLLDFLQTKKLESRFNSQAEVSICVSENDKKFFERHNSNTFVIENGVYVPENVETKKGKRIMFLGNFIYKPTMDSFEYFIKNIYPFVSDIPVEVVGEGLRSINQLNINIHGYVDDLSNFYSKCGVFVVPLLIGGGTRLKILEALANKIPVVSTKKGIEGLPLEHEIHVLVADTAEDFAKCIRKILRDTKLAEKLAENGYLFAKKYDWKIIGEKLLRINLLR
jgi:glycosyltransferase involved in cell wall biosynthesis